MLESPRGLRLIVLAAIVLCIVASLTGAKAGEERGGLRIAVVDIQKLIDENTLMRQSSDAAEKQAKDYRVRFEVAKRNPLLPEEDQRALVNLAIKERSAPNSTLSKDDKNKMDELTKRSQAMNEDFTKISSAPQTTLNPQDEVRLKNYLKTGNDSEQRLANEQTRIKNELDSKEKDVNGVVLEAMQKALADVSKKNGYNLVLNKQVAPYGEYDCTKDVLTLMNKKQPDKG